MRTRIFVFGCLFFAIATSARAITYGWNEMPGGGIEYIVQVEPAMLDAFRETGFWSDVPAGTREIRRVKLLVGEAKLPNEGKALPVAATIIDLPPPPPIDADPMASTPSPPPSADPLTNNQPAGFEEPPGAKPIDNPISSMFHGRSNLLSTPAEHGKESPAATKPEAAVPDTTQPPKLDVNDSAGGTTTALKVEAPESRPWMPLMATLVALFASLGANAYLVWIHQTLRTNYRAMVSRLKGEAAAA